MPHLKRADEWEDLGILLNGKLALSDKDIADMAAALNMSEPTVRKYFKNPGDMSLKMLQKVRRNLHIPIEKLRDVAIL